jgi:multicomponent Na+:H+ antiporter subunit E
MKSAAGNSGRNSAIIIYFKRVWMRTVVFAVLWWTLTAGVMESWVVGVPAVVVATLVSKDLAPGFSWSPRGIVHFALFFMWHSLRGGADVAWRAFHPKVPIAPGFIEYPLCLPQGLPRVLMVNTVNLLPGTLSTKLAVDHLKVHVLDTGQNIFPELVRLERVMARMFGISLKKPAEDGRNEKV